MKNRKLLSVLMTIVITTGMVGCKNAQQNDQITLTTAMSTETSIPEETSKIETTNTNISVPEVKTDSEENIPPINTTSFDGFYQDTSYDVCDEELFAMPSHISIAKKFLLESEELGKDSDYDVNSVGDISFVHGVNVDFEHDEKNESVIELSCKCKEESRFPVSLTVFVNDNGECELLSNGDASSDFLILHYKYFEVLNLCLYSGGTDWACKLLTVDNGHTNVRVGGGSDFFDQRGPVLFWHNKYDMFLPYKLIVWNSDSNQYCQLGEDELTEDAFCERVSNAQECLSQAKEIAKADIEKIYTIGYYYFFFEYKDEINEEKAVYGRFDGKKITLYEYTVYPYAYNHKDECYRNYTDNDTLLYGIDYYGITEKNVPDTDKASECSSQEFELDLAQYLIEYDDTYHNYSLEDELDFLNDDQYEIYIRALLFIDNIDYFMIPNTNDSHYWIDESGKVYNSYFYGDINNHSYMYVSTYKSFYDYMLSVFTQDTVDKLLDKYSGLLLVKDDELFLKTGERGGSIYFMSGQYKLVEKTDDKVVFEYIASQADDFTEWKVTHTIVLKLTPDGWRSEIFKNLSDE